MESVQRKFTELCKLCKLVHLQYKVLNSLMMGYSFKLLTNRSYVRFHNSTFYSSTRSEHLRHCFEPYCIDYYYHWIAQVRLSVCAVVLTSLLRFILGLPVALSLSPLAQVLALIIIKSVRMLGRRTFGATTPQASDNLLFIDRVHFLLLLLWLPVGGNVHGLPNAVLTRLWWLGAISKGKLATTNNS